MVAARDNVCQSRRAIAALATRDKWAVSLLFTSIAKKLVGLMFTDRVFRVKWFRLTLQITLAVSLGNSLTADVRAKAESEISYWFSQPEIEAFGLDTLSLEQQQALSNWIADRIGTAERDTKEALKNDSEFLKSAIETPYRIESNIVGEVTGWDGSAIFELTNGQIWRQRGTERSRRRLSNPAVVIEKNFLGFYIMTLPATGQKVRVKRIR